MINREYSYWQHNESGEVYAIETCDNEITGVCGPLHHSEVTTENQVENNFNYNTEDVEWINDNQDSFSVVEAKDTLGK